MNDVLILTKREIFAAVALIGLVSMDLEEETIARLAVVQADALIKQLNKIKDPN